MNFEPHIFEESQKEPEFQAPQEPENNSPLLSSKKNYLSLIKNISIILVNFLIILYFFILLFEKINPQYTLSNGKISNNNWVENKKINFKNKEIITIEKDFHGYESIKEDLSELIDNIKKENIDIQNIPRGILLHGEPGTGKTYLVKCLAGSLKEHATFFIVNGSDFTEMYVGLGAQRVRTIFEYAQKTALDKGQKYFFIFIDEIDSIGRERNKESNNTEQENTLNALLTQIDGFNSGEKNQKPPYGIVIGATNRKDLIDSALQREGRLGKHLYLGFPEKQGIKKLLEYYSKKFHLTKNNVFEDIENSSEKDSYNNLIKMLFETKCTPSDIYALAKEFFKKILKIENINPEKIIEYIYDSFDLLKMGPPITQTSENNDDADRIIQHELGHAIVAKILDFRVDRINVESRGKIGGYTITFSNEDTNLKTQENLIKEIIILLGGRAAEEVFLQKISIGSQNDLLKAKLQAQIMVQKLGMCPSSIELDKNELKLSSLQNSEILYTENKQENQIESIINNSYKISKQILEEYKKNKMSNWDNLKELLSKNKKKINAKEFEKEFLQIK